MMTGFKRERRYIVLKISDVHDFLPQPLINHLESIAEEVAAGRRAAGKQPIECVVVESDWPEFGPTWAAIESRMMTPHEMDEVTVGMPLHPTPEMLRAIRNHDFTKYDDPDRMNQLIGWLWSAYDVMVEVRRDEQGIMK